MANQKLNKYGQPIAQRSLVQDLAALDEHILYLHDFLSKVEGIDIENNMPRIGTVRGDPRWSQLVANQIFILIIKRKPNKPFLAQICDKYKLTELKARAVNLRKKN